ncbi:hypothetical protein HYU08_01340 [Candidatus Woesearchaeota archaeon]|nr:hypothetical protein [Candidatus Woesearchaeota archaeon]
MDYNPFDPVERAEAMRDEIIGLRTTPEVGFFNSDWYVKGTQQGSFPQTEKEKSLLDFLLFRKRWYKEPRQTPEGYITSFLSKNHFQTTAFRDAERVRIIRGNLCLEFAIEDFKEKISRVELESGVPTALRDRTYRLNYTGWTFQQGFPAGEIEIISNPNVITFLDTGNKWHGLANAFSNYYVKR